MMIQKKFKVWDTVTIVEWWIIAPWNFWYWFVWTKHSVVNTITDNEYYIVLDIPWKWRIAFKESEVSLIDNNVFYKSLMYDEI